MLRTLSCAIALLSVNGQIISDDGSQVDSHNTAVKKYGSRFDKENEEAPDLNNTEDAAAKLYKARYAYCRLESNPALKGVNMFGFLRLKNYFFGNLEISGFTRNMPKPNWNYGVSINENGWYTDSKNCQETGSHFNPTKATTHDVMDGNGHVGDLSPMTSDAFGKVEYEIEAQKATLWGTQSIIGRSMAVYDTTDYTNQIGCCHIKLVRIAIPERNPPTVATHSRRLEQVVDNESPSDEVQMTR